MGEIGLRLADDGELHHLLGGKVLHLDLIHDLDLVRADLGLVDDLGVGHKILELRDLHLQQPLSVTRRVIFSILGEVSLFPCLRDGRGDDRTLRQRVGEILLQLVQPFLGHIMNFSHNETSYYFYFVFIKENGPPGPALRHRPRNNLFSNALSCPQAGNHVHTNNLLK